LQVEQEVFFACSKKIKAKIDKCSLYASFEEFYINRLYLKGEKIGLYFLK